MALNLLQKKLLKLLAINCRFTNKDLAKALNVSADTVTYQIEKLIHKEEYAKFYVQFNYSLLGYTHYHYLVRLKDPTKTNFEKLVSNPNITFINSSHGKYDLQIIIASKNEQELNEAIQEINKEIKDNLQESTVCTFTKMHKYSHVIPPIDVDVKIPTNQKNPIYKLDAPDFAHNKQTERIELDSTDKKIIKELIKTPRESYLDIGKNIESSHETVRKRIHKFVNEGLIPSFSISQNYSKYDYFSNYLLLRLKTVDENKLKQLVSSSPNIFYCAQLLGQYNLIIYLTSQNPSEFGKEVNSIRSTLSEDILDVELLNFDQIYKNIQIPETALKEHI